MYSDADLDAAVEQGAVSADAVAALRAFVERRRTSPAVDEEHFRLLTGFNDIFVAIAAVLLLAAVGWLAEIVAPMAAAASVAAVSWGLAEYFTRRRRMALPSILLLGSFTAGLYAAGFLLIPIARPQEAWTIQAIAGAVVATAGAALHWWRFHVPITVAVGAGAAIAAVVMLVIVVVPGMALFWEFPMLAGGLALFGLAMRWDMSDRTRTTRRSDVAFWLHMAAAPTIVHPTFALLGLLGGGNAGLGRAGAAVGLYVVLALVALAVDRRALLVSALSYVLYAVSDLMRVVGTFNVSLGLTAVVVGGALLLLSAFWHPARQAALRLLPDAVRIRVAVT